MGAETLLPRMLQIGGSAMGAFGAYSNSQASKAAYNAQAQIAENNAQIAEWQSQDAISRGDVAASRQGMKTNQTKGSQRAAMAANGIDLSVGSAQNILNDTDYFGAVDRATIVDNAAREAWGYRVQASNASNNADLLRSRADSESPWLAAGTSMLTSAGKVAGTWYRSAGSGNSAGSPGDGMGQGDRRKIGVY